MLRIALEKTRTGSTITLEGRLVGPWVPEFQKYWETLRGSEEYENIQVNLKGVTSIDERGKALLRQIHQQNGTLIASGCLTKAIVEEVTAEQNVTRDRPRFANGSGKKVP